MKWKENRFDMKDVQKAPGIIPMKDEKEKLDKTHIMYILMKKFEGFCKLPNAMQIVKIDCISVGLRNYFKFYRSHRRITSIVKESNIATIARQ